MIKAAALERVVDLAGAVRGNDHDRRMYGFDSPELRDRDLEVRQHLEQECLKGFIRTIELVDEENGRARSIGLERLQQRPLDQILLGKHVMGEPLAVDRPFGFGEPDRDHLGGVVPLVDRGRDVQPFIALQPDQPTAERCRKHFCNLGLADAGLALEKERPPHAQRQEQHGRERAVGEVVRVGQKIEGLIDRGRQRDWCLIHKKNLLPAGWQGKPMEPAGDISPNTASSKSASRYPPYVRRGTGLSTRPRPSFGSAVALQSSPPFSSAAATARRAHTPTRWARYSALPWISLAMPFAGMVRPSSDLGEKRFLSASSNDGTRNTPDAPAPVTATLISDGRFAAKTPTSAKREAWLRNL